MNYNGYSLGKNFDEICKRIEKGSEADRHDIRCFILERIGIHLNAHFSEEFGEIQGLLANHKPIPLETVNRYNSLAQCKREMTNSIREAYNERNEYNHKYGRRFSSEGLASG